APVTTTAIAAIPAAKPLIRPLADEVTQPGAQAQAMPITEAAKNPLPAATTVTAAAVARNPDSAVAPLDSLPQAFQQSLPALHLDVHSYAANPADRFVVINMQRYVAGDTLKEGPRVIAITQQGVVLEYQGTRFLLPRD
ncbi:MAG TPA: general secretion pathway protein GspB, partial [Gammaproteobacteria bacterium]